MIREPHFAAFSMAFDLLVILIGRKAGVLKLKNKCSILNLFRGLGCFPQISGQVKE